MQASENFAESNPKRLLICMKHNLYINHNIVRTIAKIEDWSVSVQKKHVPGSVCHHFRNRFAIWLESFCFNINPSSFIERKRHFGLAHATGLTNAELPKLSMEENSDVSITYLLIPITPRTHEAVPSRNRDSIMISIP